MNELDILNLVTSTFSSQFSECDVELPNFRLNKDNLNEWVRLSIKPYNPIKINLNRDLQRRGTVYIQVFTKIDKGAGRAFELATVAAAIFESKMIGRVEFDGSEIREIGLSVSESSATTDSGWYQVNAMIDYKVIV